MTTVARVIRADIQAMSAYPVEDAHGMLKLDAMENPYVLPAQAHGWEVTVLTLMAQSLLMPGPKYPVPQHIIL